MPPVDKRPRYWSYLLRIWAERGHHPPRPVMWRFSLEDPHTGKRRGFPHLEALVTFLRAELASSEDDAPQDTAE